MLHKFNAFHFEVKFARKRVQWLKVYYWSQISFFLETKNSVGVKSPSTWLVFIIVPLDSNLSTSAGQIPTRLGGAYCHG